MVGEDAASQPGPRAGPGAWRLAWVVALLVAAIVFASVAPELAVDGPDVNDSALHLGLAKRASEVGAGASLALALPLVLIAVAGALLIYRAPSWAGGATDGSRAPVTVGRPRRGRR